VRIIIPFTYHVKLKERNPQKEWESIMKERMYMKKNSQCNKVHNKTKVVAYEI
jgi:hypothetical protein